MFRLARYTHSLKKAANTQATHLIFISEMGFGGKFRTDVRIVDVETSEIVEAKGFPKQKADPEVQAYIQELKDKYPGAQLKE